MAYVRADFLMDLRSKLQTGRVRLRMVNLSCMQSMVDPARSDLGQSKLVHEHSLFFLGSRASHG